MTTNGESAAETVTFLFTDVEGSTRLWENHPEAMKVALARHDVVLRTAIELRRGYVVKTTGDGLYAVFSTAMSAVRAAVDAQLALTGEAWDISPPLRVRMGLHTGTAEQRDHDYFGPTLNRAARVMAAAHGGQVLCSQATADLVIDEIGRDVGFVDLGRHRLRDLGRPERLYQLSHAELPSEFPSVRSLESFPTNLPSYLTSFVGRDAELESVARQVNECRLVTLTGTGGVGKTRLAVHAAARVLPEFPDGVWLCELAAADDADALEHIVAKVLVVNQRGSASLEAAILDTLKMKALLLVLDNCEHLLDAVARFVDGALASCPRVRVLSTSRELLGVEGEHAIGVRSLAVPSSDDVASFGAAGSVQLFVDRASAVRDGFALDSSNANALGEICRRLDGIPLAIELAAARVSAMSPSDIAGRLDERFRLLTGGRRTAVERHQTLRSTVDWSYSLLEAEERSIFERLGVFAGTFDAVAAENVVAGDGIETWTVLDALTGLVDKSMVVADETAGELMRYQLLETMRQYAREHLEAGGKADEWRRRHAEHYARVAEDVETKVIGAGEVAGRRRVLLEVDNLRAAVMWALARDDDGDQSLALRIIAGLAPLTGVDRTIGIGSWAARATEIVMTAPARLRGIVLAVAAWSAFERNEIDASRTWSEQALGHLAELPDVGVTLAYAARAGMASNLGLRRDAVALLDEGRAALHGINRAELQWGTATLQTMAAIFASLDDDSERARSSIDAALSEARALGSPSTLAVSLFALGFVLRDSDPRAALAALEESIDLMRAGAFQAVLANALLVVAQIRVEAGDRAAALEALRDALQVSLEMGGVSRTTPLVHECFVILAGSALEAAGVLWGVVTEGGAFGYVQAMLNDRDRARQDDAIRALSVLGAERLEAVSARGAAMSAEAAINFALVEIQRVTQSAQK